MNVDPAPSSPFRAPLEDLLTPRTGPPQPVSNPQLQMDTDEDDDGADVEPERADEEEDLDFALRPLLGDSFKHIIDAGAKPCMCTSLHFVPSAR